MIRHFLNSRIRTNLAQVQPAMQLCGTLTICSVCWLPRYKSRNGRTCARNSVNVCVISSAHAQWSQLKRNESSACAWSSENTEQACSINSMHNVWELSILPTIFIFQNCFNLKKPVKGLHVVMRDKCALNYNYCILMRGKVWFCPQGYYVFIQ